MWICDTCKNDINKVEDGWVEWIEYEDSEGQILGRDLRLVHQKPASPLTRGCQMNGTAEFEKDRGVLHDLPLEEFVGSDGLMHLLSLIAEGRIPLEDMLELIKRVQIPGYDLARSHFEEAKAEGIIEPNMYPGYYWQDEIKAVLDYLGKN